jgi:hypothetical protein
MYFVPLSRDGGLGWNEQGVVQTLRGSSCSPLFSPMAESVADVKWAPHRGGM